MPELYEELLNISNRIEKIIDRYSDSQINDPIDRLEKAAATVGKAWSGSWLGYQAYVYHKDLQPPPPGVHFSQEWGFTQLRTVRTTTGDWEEYTAEGIEEFIYEMANDPDLSSARELCEEATHAFDEFKSEVQSILTTALSENDDPFLLKLKEEADKISILSQSDILRGLRPSGQIMTRDTLALTQGFYTPPHLKVLSETISLKQPKDACSKLATVAKKAGSHVERSAQKRKKLERIGTNVFIGHGRSPIWKDLKDFIQDRLALPWDEFNRVPIAGITNIARLAEMLDAATIAFLVLTGEDEQADGKLHARMNVIHEAGLFQGRLGFTRAIVLLEEGCEEFSNIHGLGQIRFPKNNIKAIFEEIRLVLEREGILAS